MFPLSITQLHNYILFEPQFHFNVIYDNFNWYAVSIDFATVFHLCTEHFY